ncbi:restriction endonuclease subunit S [Dolichospermum sp. ST_sed3]|nr:restriction endonuclease subunit S [Dolichospermum sp. ST_sed9]MDD1435849.1 restriction endonuclease subunit S [Dolichospermum sp. ST_sed10]MDD1441357.1 restriction endonuclease subunit S [Dolichospermum sp. ST_sed3]MDD1448673.1 restriction endonuclease subunit S [Dolichospermum sp. ST_sed8]MDD1455415.1 restriction endonuclease subunit S [Dolichospermum sp. ST_sed7]
MGNYQGYQKYQDSGVEWLGDIPEHWRRSVFRYYFDIQLGKMLQNEPQSPNDDEISYLKAIHVRWDKVDTYELPKMWASLRDREKYYVKNGDLLICEGGEVGRTALLKEIQEECIIQNALHRVRPLKQSSVDYLNYLMRHIADTGWFDILCNKSTIAHLTSEKVGALALPLPPLNEQQKIAQFLDYKTKQIDELIKKKETLIQKLDEKRTALISHAVTKGLDSSVQMKDSGIEWLGDIPKHWKSIRIKFIGDIKYGLGEPPEQMDDGLPIIRATDIYRGIIDGSKVQRVNPDKVPWSRNPELKVGDILVVRSGAYTGDSAIVSDEWAGAIAGYDMVLTPTKSYSKYIALNLLSKHILEGQIYLAKSRAAQPHLNAEELGNTIICLPPIKEQKQIAEYLDQKTAQIDQQKAKIKEAIELLKEYRTSLITNAVTGKIDVSQVDIP